VDGGWRVVPVDAAKRSLDARWEAYFEFEASDTDVPSEAARPGSTA